MNKEILDKFMDFVAEDIYLIDEGDITPEKVKKYLEQVRLATIIYVVENFDVSILLSDDEIDFKKYIEKLVKDFWESS